MRDCSTQNKTPWFCYCVTKPVEGKSVFLLKWNTSFQLTLYHFHQWRQRPFCLQWLATFSGVGSCEAPDSDVSCCTTLVSIKICKLLWDGLTFCFMIPRSYLPMPSVIFWLFLLYRSEVLSMLKLLSSKALLCQGAASPIRLHGSGLLVFLHCLLFMKRSVSRALWRDCDYFRFALAVRRGCCRCCCLSRSTEMCLWCRVVCVLRTPALPRSTASLIAFQTLSGRSTFCSLLASHFSFRPESLWITFVADSL